jgi:hypothetical protein
MGDKENTMLFVYEYIYSDYKKAIRKHDEKYKDFAGPIYEKHLKNLQIIIHDMNIKAEFKKI